ncbi:hypothetical protein KR018_003142 [Drosophila ironensis]|nr:hypothetical protein KR018_003142 [Drosophila ironensis]
MCGGWACASYALACNNPPLSTLRFTGRDFIPTPCGPCDRCYVIDTSRKRGNNCYVPHELAPLEASLCTTVAKAVKKSESATKKKKK